MKNKKFTKTKIDQHFVERMKARFKDIDVSEIDKVLYHTKTYAQKNIDSCPFNEVRKKLRNPMYPNSRYHVNELYNMIS